MKLLKKAQIERFSNRVALSINNDETVYITASDAKNIAKALLEFSKDIMQKSNEGSTLEKVMIA